MKPMDLLTLAYAPLVARFHLIDGAAVSSRGTAPPPALRAKRAWLRDLRAGTAHRAPGSRWRTA